MDENLKIAVAMGGPGSEHDVSMASGKAVLRALTDAGCNAVELIVTDRSISVPEDIDMVFNTIHGTFGEDGGLQKLLDEQGVDYTGAGAISSELAFDKILSKKKFIEAGVPTPRSEMVDCTDGLKIPAMDLPYVVKPPREGSSVGVHICRTLDEAKAAMEDAMKFSNDVLVEQFVEGKELTVGVLDGEVLPVVHIAPRSGFYNMNNKYPWMSGDGGTDYYCPAELSPELTKIVQDAALAAHKSLGIEVYSRVDVLLDEDGNPYVLEANTIPGMTESSLLPKSAKVAGYEFSELCMKIIGLSMSIRKG
ncbi:MAG: D-alanine--D-alanine ligase [Rubritalea sp.]|jgi:D-alanine-D-alanine ligase|tara:strand:+ start:9938 stop:10858 length:921 start_codon:yes stop_codon:yes gene_type:complete